MANQQEEYQYEEEVEEAPQEAPSVELRNRDDLIGKSKHVGDRDFFEENIDEIGDATWGEVVQTCCCHTPEEWGYIFVGICALLFFLYFFLLGLELMGSSAKVLGGCTAGSLLGDDTNPVAALMIGILGTVLLQSSSTTTSIVVSLVGANTVSTRQAIYMIMGANIGTSVTNTIVAMGQSGDEDMLERAFSGATVHDMFNFLSVTVLLPIEVATGYLFYLTKAMVRNIALREGEDWEGPVKKLVGPLGAKIIVANKNLIKDVANNTDCDDFYPVECSDPRNPTYDTCKTGLIACDSASNSCPAFFESDARRNDDEVSGGVCFFVALLILITCLVALVTILQKLLLGMSTRIIYKATNINGYLAMLVGCSITILVQSSSITTSTLTPLVGLGVLHLEQMYPLTLGANIGTTVTAILAALVADTIDALQVAFAHLMFNLSGIILFYPIPFMRAIPMNAARKLGRATRIWRGFPVVYIICAFFIAPLSLLGISSLFQQKSVGFTVLGTIVVIVIALLTVYFVYQWQYNGGREGCLECLERRQRKAEVMYSIADDMEYLKAKVDALSEHTGLPDDEYEEDGEYEDEAEYDGYEEP